MAPAYSKHALHQMALRGVQEEDVKQALSHPVGPPDAGVPGTVWIRGFAVGGRILKVCVRANDNNYVITVAWPGVGDPKEKSE